MPSSLPPGPVLTAPAAPLPAATVALVKEADLGEVPGGLTLAPGPLGPSCFVAHQPSLCPPGRATTDGAGSFSYALTGAHTRGSIGNADTLDVTALGPSADSSGGTTVAFPVQAAALALPGQHLWGAVPTLRRRASGGRRPGARGRTCPARSGGASHDVRFVDGAPGPGDDWVVDGARSGTAADGRVLEDRSGSVELDASTSSPRPHTTFRFTCRSSTVPFHGPGPWAGRADRRDFSTPAALAASACAGCTPAAPARRSSIGRSAGWSRWSGCLGSSAGR